MSELELVGYVLSGATTSEAKVQLTELGERRVFEGMIVLVENQNGREVLARVDSLVPINEFYQIGDAWTEVRRKGMEISVAREVGKRYILGDLALLGELGDEGLTEVKFPPEPGDRVYTISDLKKYSKKLFGVEYGDTGYIWYGSIVGYKDVPLPLNVENLTMHMGVFGITGSGKSYGVGYLIEQLSQIPYKFNSTEIRELALPVLIVDANGDYLDYLNYYENFGRIGNFKRVYKFVFSNSRERFMPNTKEITIDLDQFTARELAEFITIYKTGGRELNELQVSALERVLREVSEYGYTELFKNNIGDIYDKLTELSTGRDAPIHHSTARAVRSAVEKFHKDIIEDLKLITTDPEVNEKFIDEITTKPSLILIDFSVEGAPGVSLTVKQLVIAYISLLLFKTFTKYKTQAKNYAQERYLLFVIEEAQNYVPNVSNYPVSWTLTRDYLAQIATQGRKFGLCLCLVSQRPAFIDPVVLSMMNTLIIHRISPEDASYIKKVCGGLPKSLEGRLTTLGRGKAIITGQMNVLGYPVLVNVGKRNVGHTMGKTNMMDSLLKLYEESEGVREDEF